MAAVECASKQGKCMVWGKRKGERGNERGREREREGVIGRERGRESKQERETELGLYYFGLRKEQALFQTNQLISQSLAGWCSVPLLTNPFPTSARVFCPYPICSFSQARLHLLWLPS